MNNQKKFGTREIALTALLLAICIVSQFFKNLSIFITGPIVNTCIFLAVYATNLPCAIVLSIITPITSYFIAASPLMMAIPGIVPLVMLGNIVIAVCSHFLLKKDMITTKLGEKIVSKVLKSVACALAKGVVMGLTISLWVIPTFLPEESPLRAKMPVFQMTFSVFQFITALIGFVYVYIIWYALSRYMKAPVD